MNYQIFPVRRFAVFIMAFGLVFSIYACGAGGSEAEPPLLGGEEVSAPAMELTEYPEEAVEAPAADEAPVEPAPEMEIVLPTFSGGEATQVEAVTPIAAFTETTENNSPSDGFVELPPYTPENRLLTLEYPPRMKAGVESELVTLTLEMDDQGNITPTAEFQGNFVQSDVVPVPDLYDTHYVTAEAQFDMAGMTIQPSGAILEPLLPGQSLTFTWSILPQDTGRYKGKVWLHLNFVDKANGDKSRKTISGQVIEIKAVDFFGLSVNFTRTSGVIGSVVGTVLGIPFLDDLLKFLIGRKRKPRR